MDYIMKNSVVRCDLCHHSVLFVLSFSSTIPHIQETDSPQSFTFHSALCTHILALLTVAVPSQTTLIDKATSFDEYGKQREIENTIK